MTEQSAAASDHLTVSRWLAGILHRWRMIAAIVLTTMLLGALAVILVPPVYRARASFVANSSTMSKLSGGIGGNVGDLMSELGVGGSGDPSESPNFYIQLLNSRELLTRLVQTRFPDPRTAKRGDSARLIDILKIRGRDEHRRVERSVERMRKAIDAGFDAKTNLVFITVDAQWPELSAQIANHVVGAVSAFNRETRASKARDKRVFLQSRLDSARIELRQAEDRQRYFNEQNRTFLGSPALRFEEARLRREVDIASDLFLTLQRQFEIARLEEFNDAALITVIDTAVAPRKAEWPRYGVLGITTLVSGLAIGFIIAGSAVVFDDWRRRNPETWADFRRAFRRKRRKSKDGDDAGSPMLKTAPLRTEASPQRADEPLVAAQRSAS